MLRTNTYESYTRSAVMVKFYLHKTQYSRRDLFGFAYSLLDGFCDDTTIGWVYTVWTRFVIQNIVPFHNNRKNLQHENCCGLFKTCEGFTYLQ